MDVLEQRQQVYDDLRRYYEELKEEIPATPAERRAELLQEMELAYVTAYRDSLFDTLRFAFRDHLSELVDDVTTRKKLSEGFESGFHLPDVPPIEIRSELSAFPKPMTMGEVSPVAVSGRPEVRPRGVRSARSSSEWNGCMSSLVSLIERRLRESGWLRSRTPHSRQTINAPAALHAFTSGVNSEAVVELSSTSRTDKELSVANVQNILEHRETEIRELLSQMVDHFEAELHKVSAEWGVGDESD